MKIIKGSYFQTQLISILRYIAKDKKSAALKFEKELSEKFKALKNNPKMYRKSNYFENNAYRDLTHYGYTIIYKIEEFRILILEIFKWQDR